MLTPALLLVLSAGDVQPAFLTDGAPRAVRLVADEPVEPGAEAPDYSSWSRLQLKEEYSRLETLRPGIGLPITLMAVGGGVLAYSIFLGISSANSGGFGIQPITILLAIAGIGGAATLVIGGIVLFRRLPDRRLYGKQLDEVERLSKERQRSDTRDGDPDERLYQEELPPPPEPIIGPPPEGPPPLPLPPMPGAAAFVFPIVFARF